MTLSNVTDERSYNVFGELESYEALTGTTQLYEATYELRPTLFKQALGLLVSATPRVLPGRAVRLVSEGSRCYLDCGTRDRAHLGP